MLKNLAFISLIICSLNAIASTDNTIFSCETKNGKIIKITQNQDNLFYSYGTKIKEEINIKQKISNEAVILGNNSGGYIYNSVIFKNGNYQYMVTALSDINVPSNKTFTGVDVSNQKKGNSVRIKCIDNTVHDNIESLSKDLNK